jgi:2-polyprenyl-3-methyl-5-hydroxy-6-metoxy-1,4-benzoquinol methylase
MVSRYDRFLNSPFFKRHVRKRLFERKSFFSRLLLAWMSVRSAGLRLPDSAEALRASPLYDQWWYYSFELLPGVATSSSFAPDFPLLPRMLLRNCDLDGAHCLDIGSVEGLMPILMCRQGARHVVATNPHLYNYEKMQAVKKCYGVNFRFRQIGSLYDLSAKLKGERGFDLINLSGVLYHVYSPMHVLAGLRPLLKRNGLLIVSTNVVRRDDYTMEFNDRGKLQRENTTFWYPSIPLYDYLLRYFKLLPIDALYHPYARDDEVRYTEDFESGYLSVVCRATEESPFGEEDRWAQESIEDSYESIMLYDKTMAARQPLSTVGYRRELDPSLVRTNGRSIDLWKAVERMQPVVRAERSQDAHVLLLADRQ